MKLRRLLVGLAFCGAAISPGWADGGRAEPGPARALPAASALRRPEVARPQTELEKLTRFVKALPGAALKQVSPMSLGQLLATIRQKYPDAIVTGRFNDARTVSIYRRHAGLHYGYDIALNAGSVVPAAWSGEVVAITPWYGQEHGISVVTGMREATYGHLIPLVKAGQHVEAGQPVGIVARDHVDVKMRGAQGEFIDFGAGEQEFAVAELTPEQRFQRYWQARYQFLFSSRQLEQAQQQRTRLLKGKDDSPGWLAKDKEWKDLYSMGAVSRLEFEAQHKQIEQGLAQARNKPGRLRQLQTDIETHQRNQKEARQRLLEAGQGLDLAAAGRYLTAYLLNHPQPAVAMVGKPVAKLKLAPIRPDLHELYEDGVISRDEFERLSGEKAPRL